MRHLLSVRMFLLFTIAMIPSQTCPAFAEDFDPVLQTKADGFQSFVEEWWGGQCLGAITGGIRFTDATRQELACVNHQGDSTIWTGMYLAAQALRTMVTQEAGARAEVLRVANYLHQAMDITDTLGYVARYAGPDAAPCNCGYSDDHDWKVHGTGEWDGYFWVHQTSRDQYSGYMLGMSLAYDAVDDPDMRATIREDFRDIVEMLVTNAWHITDENGEWTGNNASWVGPIMRLSWLVQAAHVIDEPYYWELLDEQYAANKPFLFIDVWAGLNKYMEYFGNNLRHNAYLPLFRYWPDRARLQELYDIWQEANRWYVKNTHNPWFDAVHVAGCLRLDACEQDEADDIAADAAHTLGLYFDPPAWQRAVTCSVMPLDPFSVWADQFLAGVPWLEDIVDINPQTTEARELDDRHWTDMYWQSTPFEEACAGGEDQTYTGPGMDYLLAYYMDIYYGLLPGDGPYGDDDPVDDDSADDATDDTAADDTTPDGVDDDWHDDAADDSDDDSAGSPASGGGGDDDDGCGC